MQISTSNSQFSGAGEISVHAAHVFEAVISRAHTALKTLASATTAQAAAVPDCRKFRDESEEIDRKHDRQDTVTYSVCICRRIS
jgi:hypothetical protein